MDAGSGRSQSGRGRARERSGPGVVGRGPARGRGAALVRAAGRPGLRRLARRPVVVGGLRVAASAQVVAHGKWWLAPVLLALVACARDRAAAADARTARHAACCWRAASGLVLFVAQALGIGLRGWTAAWLNALFGELDDAPGRHRRRRRAGADRACCRCCRSAWRCAAASAATPSSPARSTTVAASIVLFTAWPILRILLQAFQDGDGAFMPALLIDRLAAEKIWSLRCLAGGGRCGVAWNTLFLALCCGAGTTALGLAFALIVTRTASRFKKTLRVLTVLPIITPPFVIGLALILVFGRSGLVNQFLEWSLRHPADALDLRLPGRVSGAALRLHAGRLPGADRRRRGRQPDAGGSLADPARRPLGDLLHRVAAADAAGPGQRLPGRLHREHRRFRQPHRAGRRLRRAVDRDLLRRGRRAARLRPRRRAGAAAAGLRARRLLPAAPRRRHALLRHHLRQGRRRPADAPARPRAPRRAMDRRCRGPPSRCCSTASPSSAAW